MTRSVDAELTDARAHELDVAEAYDVHAEHVWKSLHRLGVREGDLPDLLQEVFLVVHRRRAEWDGRALRGWLFGICVGLARNYRRRALRRAERLPFAPPTDRPRDDPEDALEARRRREHGERVLASVDPEKHAIFVMFEVEGMSGREIAELLEIPLGTVHSRLYAARREIAGRLGRGEEP